MSPAIIGMFVGLLLAVAANSSGGFAGLLLAILFAAVGYVTGGHIGGQFDVRDMTLRDLMKPWSRRDQ